MTRPMFRAVVLAGVLQLSWSVFLGPPGSAVRAQQPQVAPDVEYQAALEAGELALRERRFEDALRAFTTASERQGRKSAQAFLGLCRARIGLGAHGDAAKACENGLKYVGDDDPLAARLHNERGLALTSLATSTRDKALRDAREEFRAVIGLTSEIPIAWFNLGVVAARLGDDEESVTAFRTYLDSGAAGSEAELARDLVVSPRRVREPVAPEFSVPTFNGAVVSLKSLRGQTVLLDFWGTWCPPCRAASPALVKLQKKYADEPFTIVGISSDPPEDEPKVRRYVESYDMPWPQHIDVSRKVHDAYEIDAFPTYIVIDGDGIVTVRLRGWASNTEQHLDSEIRKSLKAGAERQLRFGRR